MDDSKTRRSTTNVTGAKRQKGSDILARPLAEPQTPAERGFLRLEKNLAELAFFSPPSKTMGTRKSLKMTHTQNGRRFEAEVTIFANPELGLPTTSDQDKYFAFQQILSQIKKRDGVVSNPIEFDSGEILRILKKTDGGAGYATIGEWLNRMTFTGILSKDAVWLAGKNKWITDRFTVFTRVVTAGQELEDGSIAERNLVWLSDWQITNINQNHLIPIDFEHYLNIQTAIGKTLVPFLQIWFYATRESGRFVKRYDEFAAYLSVKQHKPLSKIRQQLGPPLDELTTLGYLAGWQIEPTTDRRGYNVVLLTGPKFYEDETARRRVGRATRAALATGEDLAESIAISASNGGAGDPRRLVAVESATEALAQACAARGATLSRVRSLLFGMAADELEQIPAYLEYFDECMARGRVKGNPGGFLMSMIAERWTLPANAAPQDTRPPDPNRDFEQSDPDVAYEMFRLESGIKAVEAMPDEERERRLLRIEEATRERLPANHDWSEERFRQHGMTTLGREVAETLVLPAFDEWRATHRGE